MNGKALAGMAAVTCFCAAAAGVAGGGKAAAVMAAAAALVYIQACRAMRSINSVLDDA